MSELKSELKSISLLTLSTLGRENRCAQVNLNPLSTKFLIQL